MKTKKSNHRTNRAYILIIVFISFSIFFVAQKLLFFKLGMYPPLTITSISANNSSVKVKFKPTRGASDYRIYDISNPKNVKYAGLTSNNGLPSPATEIEWNSVGDGQQHNLIVEAVDLLGPVVRTSLYNPDTNLPLINPLPPSVMLGSNKGSTPDGKISTNGQGPYTNNPKVIARSQPFIVQANKNYKAIPSVPEAISPFLDTFENAEGATIKQIAMNSNDGTMLYSINSGTPLSSTIQFQDVDTNNSMPFISADHFMDMLFDKVEINGNVAYHQGRGVMAFSPDATAHFDTGEMLHITEEVDAHIDNRRWMEILIVPANDPVQSFSAETDAFNTTNHVIRFEIYNGPRLTVYNGVTSGGIPEGKVIWGSAGQIDPDYGQNVPDFAYNGLAFDDRSRFDLFVTQTHAALFVDGKLVIQSKMPEDQLTWMAQPLKMYYSHYLYHTDREIADLLTYSCNPMNSYWFNNPLKGTAKNENTCNTQYPPGYGFPRSDERHWDNMGFEVLPPSVVPFDNNFSSLAKMVALPHDQTLTFELYKN